MIILTKYGKTFKITKDRYNYILSKFIKSKDPEKEGTWENRGYYGSRELKYLFMALLGENLIDGKDYVDLRSTVYTTCEDLATATKKAIGEL